MKKKLLLLAIPALLVITGCNSNFNISIINGTTYEAGLDKSGANVSYSYLNISYSYTQNGSYDVSALTKATLTFKDITMSDSNIKNIQTIKSYIDIDNSGFTVDVDENIKYFGTKNDGFAFLGNDYNDEYGYITFIANQSVKNVVVKAKQYSYLRTAFNDNELVIDQEVAVAVNDSAFIRLDKATLNEEQDQITNSTECAFSLGDGSDHITIKVGKDRAILEEINFYY